jgi:ABC-2 type transport system permease protein
MRLWNFILTEMRVMFRSRAALLWFFVMPLVYALFIGLAYREGDSDPKTWIGIVDHDQDFLSRALAKELAMEGFWVEPLSAERVRQGDLGPRALVVPAHFTRDVQAGKQVTLVLKKKPDGSEKSGALAEVNIYRAMIRLIGNLALVELENRAAGTTPDAAYAKTSAEPPRVTVQVERAGRLHKIPAGFNHTVPGMIVQFVLMCLLLYGTHLLITERESGLLRRVAAGPAGPAEILTGKLLSRGLAGALQVALLFAVGRLFMGVYLGDSLPGLALLMALYVLGVAALSLLVATLVRTREHATGLSLLVTLVVSALGGCWWPLEIVPSPLKELAFAFPTGWAMDGLHKLMAFGYGLADVWLNLLVLAGMFGLFLVLAVWRLKREFQP